MSKPFHSARLPPPCEASYSIEFPTELYKGLSAPCSCHVHGMADSVISKTTSKIAKSSYQSHALYTRVDCCVRHQTHLLMNFFQPICKKSI